VKLAGSVARGLVDLVPALAVMLGANVGTTLIVQVLSFNVADIAPALILVGVLMFRRASAAPRDFGRVLIGLGLLLMADVLGTILSGLRDAFTNGDRRQIAETKRLDDVLDKLNTAIKVYLTSIDPEALSDADHRRVSEVLAFALNMEHAGDIVVRNLLSIASRRLKRGVSFSHAGRAELLALIDRLQKNLKLAASLFMSGDERAARLLAAEKEVFRKLETEATQAHFERLRAGRLDTVETSTMHLDALRDLKSVNTHLVAAAAYPVLENTGELLPSRIRQDEDGQSLMTRRTID